MAQPAQSRRERLGAYVKRQRLALGLSVRAAAAKADVNRATWEGVESGRRSLQDFNYAKIERALEWAPGSIGAVMAGGEPTLADDQVVGGVSIADLESRSMSAAEVLEWVDSEPDLSREGKAAIRAIVEELERRRRQ